MDLNKNYIKKRICIRNNKPALTDAIDLSYYITVFLTKTYEIFEYVDVKKDEKIYKINKQEINPFYINFGFFNSIKRVKVNTNSDLTPIMINYLNSNPNYKASIEKYSDTKSWFSDIGYSILIDDVTTTTDDITGETKIENGLDKLEKLEKNIDSVVSKSFYFPIVINK